MPLKHYLIVYNHGEQKLLQAAEYTDVDEATAAYAELERRHRGDTNLEIVLVGSDSLDTIRLTHGNYFDGEDTAAVERLAGAH
ncbi:MAG TPA: hypothetical protein VIM33_12690 [Gaiellaceae bacterium]|jgi:hypothetical protein